LRTWQTCADEGIALYKRCQLLAAEECLVESVRRARNENVEKPQLSQALNSLAVVYFARSKYHDATNVLRESLLNTESEETESARVQKALATHIYIQMLVEQERFFDARNEIILALQQLGDDLKFCSAELWFSLVKVYVGLGDFNKADDAIDSFLETTPLSLIGPHRIFIDESCGGSYFGPGWGPDISTEEEEEEEEEENPNAISTTCSASSSSSNRVRIEAEVRAKLVRASLQNQLPSQAKEVIEEVLDLCKPLGDHALTAQAMIIASRLAFGDSEWAEAAKYCQSSLEIVEKLYGENHPALLAYLINTASVALMTDGLPNCKVLMDRTFQIVLEYFGPRHPKYARCQLLWSALIPFVEADNGDMVAAQEQLILEALDTFLDYFDDTHNAVLSARLQFAELLIKTSRVDEADMLLRQLLADATTISGTNPYPRIACLTEMLKLADTLATDDRYRLWDFIHQEASKTDCQSITVAGRRIDVMRQLAFIFQRLGDKDTPETLLRNCFELSLDVCTDLHHRCKQDLVDLLLERGKPKEALELLESSTEEKTLTQELREQLQIIKVNIALNRLAEAEKIGLETLARAERILPDCSDSFMQLIGILTDLYLQTSRLDDAVRMVGILTSHKPKLGVAVLDVIPLSLRLIAEAFAAQRDTRAEQLYLQSIAAAEDIQGKAPETLDASIVAFADYCLNNGQVDKARKLFERWLDLRIDVCGANSFPCAIAMLNVAEVNADNDLNKSLQLSCKALEIMDAEDNVAPEYLVAALHLRAAILEKANYQLEAMAIVERARAIERQGEKKRKSTGS
jgi:tetratricopeptide (TPR) repeat protein